MEIKELETLNATRLEKEGYIRANVWLIKNEPRTIENCIIDSYWHKYVTENRVTFIEIIYKGKRYYQNIKNIDFIEEIAGEEN